MVKVVKDLEKEEPNVTAKFFGTTSKASPSQPFVAWPDEEV
jgi:hypothetical protein